MHKYYAVLGAHEALNNSQDFLIKPKDLDAYKTQNYFVFYSENQGASVWGVKKEDMPQDNPPIYENYGNDEWYKTCDEMTSFLTSMAYLQAVFSMNYSNEEYWDITKRQANEISQHFKSKNADLDLYTGVRFYGDYCDAVIAVMNNCEDSILFFSSNSKAHFDEMYEILEKITES